MVKVNLLPPKERTKKHTIRENFISILLSIVAVGLIVGFSFLALIYGNALKGKIKNVEGEILKQQESNSKYKDIETIITDLNKNIERIKNLQKQNPKWSVILDQIREKMPINLVLEEISAPATIVSSSSEQQKTSEEKTGNKNESQAETKTESKESKKQSIILTLKGLSEDQYSIAKFREALSASAVFDYVDFESSIWQQEKARFEFVIKAKIKI